MALPNPRIREHPDGTIHVLTKNDNLVGMLYFLDSQDRLGEYAFKGLKDGKIVFYFTDANTAFEFKMNFGG